jgi:hypothetical protein
MEKRLLMVFALVIALSLQTGFVWAGSATEKFALTTTGPAVVEENTPLEDQEQIYGVQLMTPLERSAFRARMSAAKTLEERELIRDENHQAMQERAQSHGLTLPDQVPADKRGMGEKGEVLNQGGGMGQGGMGSGGGMGTGGGYRQ